MKYDFFLITTFILQTKSDKTRANIRCLGSREIIKTNREVPQYILGMIEFESFHIPVVDIGAAFGVEPIRIDSSRCILIVEHNHKSHKFHTGVIIQDVEEIMKFAAGDFEPGTGLGSSPNMHFILEMQNNSNDGHEILAESHEALSLLKKSKTEILQEYSGFQISNSGNFISMLQKLDFVSRRIIMEALSQRPELWDRETGLMRH